MSRVKKPKPTLDSIFFVTPEQKLIRFLLSESSTSFTPRVLSSKLKGVRGLGGAEGIVKILQDLQDLGFIQFIDNNRSVIVRNDHSAVKLVKIFGSACDLEGLVELLQPISSKGILFGSRSSGNDRTDSNYNLFVASDMKEDVQNFVSHHPLGKKIEVVIWAKDDYAQIEKKDSVFANKLSHGVVLWGAGW